MSQTESTETLDDTVESLTKVVTKNLKSVIADLRKVGIQAVMTSRANSSSATFSVQLELYPERHRMRLSLLTPRFGTTGKGLRCPRLTVVAASARHKQAVLSLVEDARVFKESVQILKQRGFQPPNRDEVIGQFPISLPRGTKFEVKKTNGPTSGTAAQTTVDATQTTAYLYAVTARVPASVMTFLVGKDENHLFISALPKPAKSVEHAHRILMPKEVVGKRGVLRQGEWFFIPATREERAAIARDRSYSFNTADSLGEGDHDVACTFDYSVSRKKIQLAAGVVVNNRHKNLVLDGWYRVVRNTELESRSSSWD